MIGRISLERGTPERAQRQKMKASGSSERDAARVGQRVGAERLGVQPNEIALMEAAAAKRVRKAGRGLPAVLGTSVPANTGAEEPLPVPKMAAPVFIQDENEGAVSDTFVETVERAYVGTRSGEQVLEAEMGDDAP